MADTFLGVGQQHTRFAREEPELYRLLFLTRPGAGGGGGWRPLASGQAAWREMGICKGAGAVGNGMSTTTHWEASMEKTIATCGLDCGACEARLATVRNDEALRRKVADLWSALNGVEITPEMIHCVGCRLDGVKTPYCESLCPIRQCALRREVETCGDCGAWETCEKVGRILENNADARSRLEACSRTSDREGGDGPCDTAE